MGDWQGELHTGGQVVLDANGSGSITVWPDNGHQRWEVREIYLWCDQNPGSPLPTAEVKVINESRGRGRVGHTAASASIHGPILVGPADYLTILITSSAVLMGATVFCKIEGSKLRRWT